MRQKITIVGDIMCEPLLLEAARRAEGEYCFDGVFAHVGRLFADADFVIGNFETPMAGEEAGYVSSLFSFNAPASFAAAAGRAGISLLLTANNHCLDRGPAGLDRTLRTLDELKIDHTGTYLPGQERDNYYFTIGETRYAVVSYTYGTNYSTNHIHPDDALQARINLLRPAEENYYDPSAERTSFSEKLAGRLLRRFPLEKRIAVKKALGMTYHKARADDFLDKKTAEPYLAQMEEDIRRAKEQADVTIFCPHVGGQFNREPGVFSKYVFSKALRSGADAVIASHAHVVQKAECWDGAPCYFSLGNFSMSPNSVYLLPENLPQYGLAAHLYVESGTICKTTFSILKIVEEGNTMLTVYPVEELFRQISEEEKRSLMRDVEQIHAVVTGRPFHGDVPSGEYELVPEAHETEALSK